MTTEADKAYGFGSVKDYAPSASESASPVSPRLLSKQDGGFAAKWECRSGLSSFVLCTYLAIQNHASHPFLDLRLESSQFDLHKKVHFRRVHLQYTMSLSCFALVFNLS